MDLRSLGLLCALAALSAGCGAGPLQLRTGSVASCRSAVPSDQGSLLGWLSLASLDSLVATADRVGQQSQLLAPGSSVRDRLTAAMSEGARQAGVKDVAWFDWTRPVHLLLHQRATARPDASPEAVVVVPIHDRAKLTAAAAEVSVAPTQGADAALRLRAHRDRLSLRFAHPTTVVAASDPAWLATAEATSRCAQELRPAALVQFGVSIDALRRHHGPALERLGARLTEGMGARESSVAAMVTRPYQELLQRTLEGATTAELGLSSQGDDVNVQLSIALRGGSAWGASAARVAAAGPGKLAARLPATSWLLAGQVTDQVEAIAELERQRPMWRALLPDLDVSDTVAALGDALRAGGAHGAFAIHSDGPFPFAFTAIYSARDPAALRDALVRAVLALGAAFARSPAAAALPAPVRAALAASSATGIMGLLEAASADKPVRLEFLQREEQGTRCDVLRAHLAQALFSGPTPLHARAGQLIGPTLEVALCTQDDAVVLTFGRDAVALAAAARAGRPDAIIAAPWFKRAFPAGAPGMFGALQPRPLVELGRTVVPILPAWPETASLHVSCTTEPLRVACALGVPVVPIATFVGAFRRGM